jgi:hypothetical protein
MPALRACALVCAVLLFVVPAFAQEKKPAELLPGKWELKEKVRGVDIHFFLIFTKTDDKSGTLKMEQDGKQKFEGSYTWLKDDELEVALKTGGEPQKQKFKLKFSNENNTLETTDEQQKTEKFNRVK